MRPRLAVAVVGALAIVAPLGAQKPDRDALRLDSLLAAPRPRLTGDADTNDVDSYVAAGRELAERRRHADAAVMFLWASRLSPARAQPMLLAWNALWASSPDGMRKHAKGDRKFAATGVGERIDSLMLRAMLRDPFATPDDLRGSPWRRVVLDGARRAAAKDSNAVGPRVFLAIELFQDRAYDSTITRLGEALRALARRDTAATRPVYESREIFHYALGHAHTARGDRNAAVAAYRRALEENAGFYPAHARLGFLAWDNWADSATALLEYEAAVATAPHDAALRNDYGATLLAMRRPAAALAQFEAGLALAPEYVLLSYNAALAADRIGDRAAALRHYERFAARAPWALARQVREANERIVSLRGKPGS